MARGQVDPHCVSWVSGKKKKILICLSFPICMCFPVFLTPGSQMTLQDLSAFQPEVVDALEMPLGNYTLYSPPPPAGGAVLSFILNVLRGKIFPSLPS